MPKDTNQRAASIVTMATAENQTDVPAVVLVWSLENNAVNGGRPLPPITTTQVPATTAMVTS
jgi:hypothetical protein